MIDTSAETVGINNKISQEIATLVDRPKSPSGQKECSEAIIIF
jgi:hypothetical protein